MDLLPFHCSKNPVFALEAYRVGLCHYLANFRHELETQELEALVENLWSFSMMELFDGKNAQMNFVIQLTYEHPSPTRYLATALKFLLYGIQEVYMGLQLVLADLEAGITYLRPAYQGIDPLLFHGLLRVIHIEYERLCQTAIL